MPGVATDVVHPFRGRDVVVAHSCPVVMPRVNTSASVFNFTKQPFMAACSTDKQTLCDSTTCLIEVHTPLKFPIRARFS